MSSLGQNAMQRCWCIVALNNEGFWETHYFATHLDICVANWVSMESWKAGEAIGANFDFLTPIIALPAFVKVKWSAIFQ
jgi:hypothetical protein